MESVMGDRPAMNNAFSAGFLPGHLVAVAAFAKGPRIVAQSSTGCALLNDKAMLT
jgi:hypothetical protein